MRLCAGCAAEVDRNRVCETCHEIYVAAKATPQSIVCGSADDVPSVFLTLFSF
jgi:hypothetical protein